jgi:hypothetical protein
MAKKHPDVRIGTCYGDWLVVDGPILRKKPSGQNDKQWKCRCSCGLERPVSDSNLKTGKTLGCGCRASLDLAIGDVFGKWTVVGPAIRRTIGTKRPESFTFYMCRCDCGEERPVKASNLFYGRSLGCGSCQTPGSVRTKRNHMTRTERHEERKARTELQVRCQHANVSIKLVQQRMARGMSEAQALGLAPRPSHGPSGRRIGITVPTAEGPLVFATLPEACDFFGLRLGVVRNRLGKKWSEAQAFQVAPPPPHRPGNRKALSFVFNGNPYSYESLTEAAAAHGLSVTKVGSRLHEYGWTPPQALGLESPPPRHSGGRRGSRGRGKPVRFTYQGRDYAFPSLSAAALEHGLTRATVRNRIYRSEWTWPQALNLAPPPDTTKYCYGFAYVITHRSSGKQYIGQTLTTVQKRWVSHVYRAFRRTPRNEKSLAAAIRKHGAEAFDIEVIDVAHSQHELNRMEQRLICNYDTRVPYGYNLTRGGGGFARKTRIMIGGTRYASYADAARANGLSPYEVYKRLEDGLTPEQAIRPEASA